MSSCYILNLSTFQFDPNLIMSSRCLLGLMKALRADSLVKYFTIVVSLSVQQAGFPNFGSLYLLELQPNLLSFLLSFLHLPKSKLDALDG